MAGGLSDVEGGGRTCPPDAVLFCLAVVAAVLCCVRARPAVCAGAAPHLGAVCVITAAARRQQAQGERRTAATGSFSIFVSLCRLTSASLATPQLRAQGAMASCLLHA